MPSNPWVEHVKKFARDHGVAYGCAIADPRCKNSYKKSKPKAGDIVVFRKKISRQRIESRQMGMEDINRAGEPYQKPYEPKPIVARHRSVPKPSILTFKEDTHFSRKPIDYAPVVARPRSVPKPSILNLNDAHPFQLNQIQLLKNLTSPLDYTSIVAQPRSVTKPSILTFNEDVPYHKKISNKPLVDWFKNR